MEIFRGLGSRGPIRAAGKALAGDRYMLWVETLAGAEIRRVPLVEIGRSDRVGWRRSARPTGQPAPRTTWSRSCWPRPGGAALTCASGGPASGWRRTPTGSPPACVDRESRRAGTVRAEYWSAPMAARSGVRSALGIGFGPGLAGAQRQHLLPGRPGGAGPRTGGSSSASSSIRRYAGCCSRSTSPTAGSSERPGRCRARHESSPTSTPERCVELIRNSDRPARICPSRSWRAALGGSRRGGRAIPGRGGCSWPAMPPT